MQVNVLYRYAAKPPARSLGVFRPQRVTITIPWEMDVAASAMFDACMPRFATVPRSCALTPNDLNIAIAGRVYGVSRSRYMLTHKRGTKSLGQSLAPQNA